MSNARNLARLLPNASGQLPDAAMSSGSVIQVVTAQTNTPVTSTTNTFVDTGLTASITPTSSSNKILVLTDMMGVFKSAADGNNRLGLRLLRNSTVIDFSLGQLWTQSPLYFRVAWAHSFTDSPNTTSPVTYKWQFNNEQNVSAAAVQLDGNSGTSQIILMEIAA